MLDLFIDVRKMVFFFHLFSLCHILSYRSLRIISNNANQLLTYAAKRDSGAARTTGQPAASRPASASQKERHLWHRHIFSTTCAMACERPRCAATVATTISSIAIPTHSIMPWLPSRSEESRSQTSGLHSDKKMLPTCSHLHRLPK